MKLRFASLLLLGITAVTAAHAADVPASDLNVVSSIRLTAASGDTIFAAKSHRHEYIYLTHAADKSVDVIDVTDPSSPRQLSGNEARRASRNAVTAMISTSDTPGTARVLDISDPSEPHVVAEFPNAISTTSDNRKLIYVLDQNSLRILSTKPAPQPAEDDSWFKNAMAPG
jgi:hypothetical protein